MQRSLFLNLLISPIAFVVLCASSPLFLQEKGLSDPQTIQNEIKKGEFKNFKRLLGLIEKGDPSAMKLGMATLPLTDGEFAEGLNIALGRSLKVSPHLFLSLVKKQATWLDQADRLESLLLNFGGEFVDASPEKRGEETARRIETLLRVTDDDLSSVRDQCLWILRGKPTP